MEESLVSVIVPIYNIEQYIDECVESILNQTYRNLEVILVDDGSKDRSSEKIDEWAKKDSRVVALHKKNGGQGDTRNFGFAHSTGDYISYIDGDDWVDKTYIEKLMYTLIKNDADMSGCRFFRNKIDGDGYIYPRPDETYRFCENTQDYMIRVYNNFGVFCGPCMKIYKRKVIVENMFPNIRIAEDAMVIREISFRCEKIAYIPDALYMYRNRPNSVMTTTRHYTLEEQKLRMLWLDEDMKFYRKIHNNILLALAEKAFCYYIYNDWKFFDAECRRYYKGRYFKALKHMLVTRGNSYGAKCKYTLFGLKLLVSK